MSAPPTCDGRCCTYADPGRVDELVGPELDRDLGSIARRALWRRPAQRRLLPGHDRELSGFAWRLGDQYGDVWRPMRDEDGRKVWTCEQCPELALKWTSPALAVAGPFIILPADDPTVARVD